MPETTASPAHPRSDALNAARETRSREKRQAVEGAIRQLRDARQAVTFVAVARLAKVSRQYLYNNFSDEISDQRSTSRAAVEIVAHSGEGARWFRREGVHRFRSMASR